MRLSHSAIVFGFVCFTIAGCYNPAPEGLRADLKRKDKGDDVVPTIGDSIPIRGTETLAFPFAIRVNDEGQSKFGIGSGSLGSSLYYYDSTYREDPGFSRQTGANGWMGSSGLHWNNVVLLDPRTGKAQLVFDRKVVITAAFFPDEKGTWEQGLLFAVAEADSNKDKYINEGDAVVLYHYGIVTRKLTAVTPTSGAQFRWFQVLDGAGKSLGVRVRTDTNGDGAFTAADETVLLQVAIGPSGPYEGKPMLPAELLKRAFDIVAPAAK